MVLDCFVYTGNPYKPGMVPSVSIQTPFLFWLILNFTNTQVNVTPLFITILSVLSTSLDPPPCNTAGNLTQDLTYTAYISISLLNYFSIAYPQNSILALSLCFPLTYQVISHLNISLKHNSPVQKVFPNYPYVLVTILPWWTWVEYKHLYNLWISGELLFTDIL